MLNTDVSAGRHPVMLSRRACLTGMLGLAASSYPAFGREPGRSIVAVNFAVAQTMLAMGIAPAAIPLKPLYSEICVSPPLPPETVDIGLANQPNIALLLDLAADAIVIGSGQERLAPMFEKFARVIRTSFTRSDPQPYALAVQETLALSQRLGSRDRAERLIHDTRTMILGHKSSLDSNARPVFVVTLMPDGRHATIWGLGSLAHDVLTMLGIRNAWHDPVQQWGSLTVGVERLAAQPDAGLIYIVNADADRAIERLSDSPLWTSLPFVRKGRVVGMPAFYPYGGLPAATRCAEGLTDALLSLESRNG